MKRASKNSLRYITFIFLALVSLISIKSYATDGTFKGSPLYGKNRQIAHDSIIYVADTILNNSSLRAGWSVRKVRNIITFKIDEFANLIIPDTFHVTLNFRFTTTKWVYSSNQPATAVTTTADSTLTISYDKDQTYNGKVVLVLPDVFNSSVKISSVSITDTTTNLYKSLMVESEIQTWKEYTSFDCTNSAIQVINQSTATVGTEGELKVYWSPITGADEYDLEWSYIDSSALSNYYITGTTNYDQLRIFENNASRVTTPNENYTIPLLYDSKGTLFFRARSVQVKDGQRVESNWSSVTSGALGSYLFDGHERKLNWQASTSFAEDGKRKSVIQYFDGSLRNRQTVTKDNTTDTTIVAETLYDNQGRPVIQVLPSPSLTSIIKYIPNFNTTINGSEYDKSNYDDVMTDATDYCAKGASKFGTQSGASQYYSPQNQNANNGFNKFIPDAKGYPFAETKYTQDNTGRISAQGGVGPNHQLGQTDVNDNTTVNHETKYYYGSANQEDLDALFGTEVGNASHYFKNMVRDANGQFSVSYIDMHGRTVATALAGSPLNQGLDLLPSNQSATVTKKLLDSNNNIIKGTAIESTKDLVVTKNGTHYFSYSLTPQSLQLPGCDTATVCYDCLYDLTITITDNCNNQNLPGGVPHVITRKNFTIPQPDTTCTNSAGVFNVLDTLTLTEGVYSITKKLEISKYAQDYYRDSIFLKHNTCKSIQQFITEQRQIILNNLNCGLTCQQCSDSLGTWTSFRAKYMQKLGISIVDSANYRGEALQAYNAQKNDCDELCEKHSVLDDMLTNMLADVTAPSGQYANDADSEEKLRDYYSIFNRKDGISSNEFRYQTISNYQNPDGSASHVLDPNQILQNPEDLSGEQFSDNFQSSWAASLLPFHPEYNKYQKLSKFKPSFSWDELFLKVETFREAYNSGYLNPTGNATSPFNKYPIVSANTDPFYQNEIDSFQTNIFKTAMETYMKNVSTDQVNTISMWATATSMAKCENGDNTCLDNYKDGTHAFDSTGTYGLCKGELDMAWRYFREMYINKKRTLTNDFINSTTISPAIGSQHVLQFPDINPLIVAGGDLDTSLVTGIDSLTQFINDNCVSAAVQWWNELAPCYYTSNDSSILIPRLIAVCEAGGDDTHPYGSSSVKPGSTNQYKSFEEVIKNYNLTRSPALPYNSTCNAELITSPLPYDQQQASSNIEVWSKPDSCLCSTITTLYNQYTLNPGTDSSFAAYVTRANGATITESNLQTLRNMCTDSTYCKFIEAPIVVPPSLQCGITNACVSCVQVRQVYDSFLVRFPNQIPKRDEPDTIQQKINSVFTNYMNHHLGFSKSNGEYLDFMSTCGSLPGYACDSLQATLKSYKQNVRPGKVINNLGEYNSSQIIDNGTIHFPDSMRQQPNYQYHNYEIKVANGYSFCTGNGYSAEVRFKLYPNSRPYNGDVFYTAFATHADIFLVGKSAPYLWADTNLLETNSDALYQWMTLKTKVLPSHIDYYYNDRLIRSSPRDSTSGIENQWIFNLTMIDYTGIIDWFKIRDAQGNIKYFEDFNDANNPAFIDSSFICPGLPDCQTSFKNYFNQQYSTNYTFSQIDSIYYNTCGANSGVCVNSSTASGPRLCGKTEPAFPNMRPTQWGPCDDSTNFALIKGTQLYEATRDSLNNVFDQAYIQKCLSAQKLESFTVRAPVSEYHYTLYYYGQAGNLVKTIPPQGVDMSKFSDANWSTNVGNARKNNQVLEPSHTLQTIYRYNSLNQVVAQSTPDAGVSSFWYDRLGRLTISQNAKQKNFAAVENGRGYSYTLYDYIGRITEVGEYVNPSTTPMADALSRNQSQLDSWLATQANRSQITSTVYDLEYSGWVTPKLMYAKNLRDRVAYTSYATGSNPLNFTHATFYSYDILGNVDTLIQDFGNNLAGTGIINMMNNNGNRWKKMVYRYDLISGKVNHVAYQPQYINTADSKLYTPSDAFYHKYEYDAENRLTTVYTSLDSIIWEKDARYEYYKHGPLARTTLGDQLVQGIDYAYTLQGWLKGVNGTGLLAANEMGKDGNIIAGQNQNEYVAKDAFAYALNYFSGDSSFINSSLSLFPNSNTNSNFKPLYNGNIGSMVINVNTLVVPGSSSSGAMLYNYKYDQLNRITAMDAYKGLTNNKWTPALRSEYKERITYDANGNILKYLRNGDNLAKIVMDSFNYKYDASTNRLNHVDDNVPDADYASPGYEDTDDQDIDNYTYDAIGNLIKDNAENITNISWNVYGKITAINYGNTAVNSPKNVYYYYDAAGNRMGKRAEKNVASGTTSTYTWYVRDASGNVMTVYSSTASNSSTPTNLTLKERDMYGSSRLGILSLTKDVKAAMPSYTQTTPYKSSFTRGNKYYELSNHLGNVLATISDKKIAHTTNGNTVDYYDAYILTASDFMPFGSTLPGRTSGTTSAYRYSFNGKEKDKDGAGTSVQYDYGFRIYDPHLGRFKSVDPSTSTFPFYSPYQYAGNTPIQAIDLDGLEEYVISKDLYKNGKTKSITIQFTKDKSNNLVNVHFREVLGNNSDGTNKLGSYLTGSKVFRIIRDANNHESKGKMNDNLSREEKAVVDKYTINDKPITPSMNAWDITVNETSYISETERNTKLMTDKIATQNFPLIQDLNQKFHSGGLVIGGSSILSGPDMSGNTNFKNGHVDWLFSENQKIKSLVSQIKEDGGIKSISITVSLNISNATDAEYSIFKAGVESIGTQMKAAFTKSGVDPQNITLKTESLRDNQSGSHGIQISLKR